MAHAFSETATNVAEGYPAFAFTPSQQAIVDRFPELLARALATPYPALAARAQRAFFDALGQKTAPVGTGRVIDYYAASVAIDVLGRCLTSRPSAVGVIHPTLDILPALIRGRGLQVVPVSERQLLRRNPLAGLDGVGALYIAIPNNPTGTVMGPEALRHLAEACARNGVVLAIDACFRAFDVRSQYDTYAVLEATGVDYAVIEDTGKLWPLGGVRLSFMAFGANSTLGIPAVSSDLLLMAPPFAAAVVEEFALDMASGGLERIHARLANNRSILERALEGCERGTVVSDGGRVSVALIKLAPGVSSTRLWGRLLRRDVQAVPGRPMWWARPAVGERYLRVALGREPAVVERAATAIRAELDASTGPT
ncbi:MAG: pyridoxal phosphate-dependent aminotransferase [Candidatus Limnocylindrales bacterium]